MMCDQCGFDTPETKPIKAEDFELEAARFFYEATLRAMRGHFGANEKWESLREEVRQAMGIAAGEFKRRFVCAG